MSTIDFHQTTTLTPEQYIAGLTDFSPGRAKVFSRAPTTTSRFTQSARPRQTSRKAPGRLGAPALRLVNSPTRGLTTTDSNVWGGSSGYTYTFKQLPNGMTEVDVIIVREGKNAKGRTLGLVLGSVGKGVLAKAFGNSVKAIEVRNNGAPAR